MAYVFATRAFNMWGTALDFGRASRLGDMDAILDRPFTVRGTSYNDRVVISPDAGGTHLILGSKGFSAGANAYWVNGDVNGVFLSTGSGPSGIWAGIQGISVGVLSLDMAITTFWGGDDLDLIEAELAGADRFELSEENDCAFGYAGRDTMIGRGGADQLDSGNGDDSVHGGSGADVIWGGGGADILIGGSQNDWLYGGAGADRLLSDQGRDGLVGGADRDLFVFRSRWDTTGSTADSILDFARGTDRIDLRPMDARAATAGVNDAFLWSGKVPAKFAVWWKAGATEGATLMGDVTGDARPDFAVHVFGAGVNALSGADVLL